MCKISVILTIYNKEKYLKKCLDSLLSQNFKNLEIVAINDGSTDKSLEILKKYEKQIIIFSQHNQGVSAARNLGIENSSGDYIWFIDADDWVSSDSLREVEKLIVAHSPDLILMGKKPYFGFYSNFIKNKPHNILDCLKNLDMPYSLKEAGQRLFDVNFEVCTKIASRDFLERNNIKFDPIQISEDLPYHYRCLLWAKKIVHTHKELYYYRRNISTSQSEKKNKMAIDIIKAMEISHKIAKEHEDYENFKEFYANNCNNIYNYWLGKFQGAEKDKLFEAMQKDIF